MSQHQPLKKQILHAAIIRDLTATNRELTVTNRNLTETLFELQQERERDSLVEENAELREQVDDQTDEIIALHRQIAELKKQKTVSKPRREKWQRPADYAQRFLSNWEELFWNTSNSDWIKACWDATNEQFVVSSTYEKGRQYFSDLKDVATYFAEKSYIPKGYNVWREFRDGNGNSVNRLDRKKSSKRRSRA